MKLLFENWRQYVKEAQIPVTDITHYATHIPALQARASQLALKMLDLEDRDLESSLSYDPDAVPMSDHTKNASHNTWSWFEHFSAEWVKDPEQRVKTGKKILARNFHKDIFEEYWNKPSDDGKVPREELPELDPRLAGEVLEFLDILERAKNETPT